MYDIVFLHPPTSLGKLNRPLSGIFGALVASTDMLCHEPVGMITMAHDLTRKGYKTRIYNVGKMLLDLRHQGTKNTNSIRGFIKVLQARIYAIGLHWAAHAPGAVELARLVKAHHPDRYVVLGGMTATYYHKEILEKFPFVDMVVMGEVDGLIHEIVDALLQGRPFRSLPNICYRAKGKTVSTELKPPEKRGSCYVRGARDELIEPNTSFSRWDQGYVRECTIPLLYGCHRNCVFCGGSHHFYKEYFGRDKAEGIPVADVLANVKAAVDQGARRISLFGDSRLLGDGYWRELTGRLSREHLNCVLYMELFEPATKDYMEAWRSVTSGKIIMAFSPESADAEVRLALGKDYSNEDVAEQVVLGLDLGINVSLGFTFPLPKQDFPSIVRTQDFITGLCRRFDRLINYMFEPFLFLDPGSMIFDHPEVYGYHLSNWTLEELIHDLSAPHWYCALNYTTEWMNKKDIIDAMFFVGRSRNELQLAFQGPCSARLRHRALLSQQRELVDLLTLKPDLSAGEIEDAIVQIIDEEFREMNFSITAPDFDFAGLSAIAPTISDVFENTTRMISRCHYRMVSERDLLSAFGGAGLLDDDIPVGAYEEELLASLETGGDLIRLPFPLPGLVRERFDAVLASLKLDVVKSVIDELIRYDWALFLMKLYARARWKHDDDKSPPQDIQDADVLLPPRNAFLSLRYKHQGSPVRRGKRFTLERLPAYVVVAYSGIAHPVAGELFGFLKESGVRIPFFRFHQRAGRFQGKPEELMNWLVSRGLILLSPRTIC